MLYIPRSCRGSSHWAVHPDHSHTLFVGVLAWAVAVVGNSRQLCTAVLTMGAGTAQTLAHMEVDIRSLPYWQQSMARPHR